MSASDALGIYDGNSPFQYTLYHSFNVGVTKKETFNVWNLLRENNMTSVKRRTYGWHFFYYLL